MVILGLGSNLNDRLKSLRACYQAILKTPGIEIKRVSPLYQSNALLPDHAPPSWNTIYYNLALQCETRLKPEELLQQVKHIEKQLGRRPEERWGPRIIDIDILAWDNLILDSDKLHIPHQDLHQRPFALWPLTDLIPLWMHPRLGKTAAELAAHWGNKFSGQAPLNTKQINQRIDTPQLIGILNITPDSFSDGGHYFGIENAIQRAQELYSAGADIIDIGAESTRPGAVTVPQEIEWERLCPVLTELKNRSLKISIDTRHPATAEKALTTDIHMINDVSGLENPFMREQLAHSTCNIVFMHHLTIPADKNRVIPYDQNPVLLVHEWAKKKIEQLQRCGISKDRLIFDPGIGFGKRPEQSFEILKNMKAFADLGVRLLIGHSRKSFLHELTNTSVTDRDLETVLLSIQLKNSVDYLRIHDVAAHARAFKMQGFI